MLSDFLHFCKLLNEYGVDYLVTGGYAVNLYGYTRMTEDVDIFFKPDKNNGKKLLKALEDYGVETGNLKNHDFAQPTHLRLGEYPKSIDIFNHTIGIDIEEVFDRKVVHMVEEVPLDVLHIDDLIQNKKALNTYKDLADAEELIKIKNKRNK